MTYAWAPPPSEGAVDWRAVHAEHWRAWTIAADGRRGGVEDTLRAALGPDAGAARIADGIFAAAAGGDRAAFEDGVHTWNAAMGGRGLPWALRPGQAGAYVKSYHVLARPRIGLGGQQTPVAIGVRVDRTNVVEGWLGSADDVGDALVVTDRVLDFAVDEVWPRLDPADTTPYGLVVRGWAARLDPAARAPLERTAAARAGMVRARAALQARNAACGGSFRVRFGWSGLDDLAGVRSWVGHDADPRCPGILDAEADALVAGSLAVRREPGLPEALEVLLAAVTAHVLVHEARHVLDHDAHGVGTPPPCGDSACDAVDGPARIELSAYLSAYASPEWPLAWVQSCQVAADGPGTRAGRAIRALVGALHVPCDGEPPTDVPELAAGLARAWFDRAEDVGFVDPPPGRLPLGAGG